MSECIAPGWGVGPYGTTPWGGGLSAIPGGPIPAVAPFDIYCVGPCGPMSVITTYDEVDLIGDGTQFFVDPVSMDQIIVSGGAAASSDAILTITTTVPPIFTFDFTVKFNTLPADFSSLVTKHIAIGITDAAGPCISLFFSKVGVGYSGAFHHVGGDLILDSTFQNLPDSQTAISENEYWSYRVAVDVTTGVVYIYITKTSDLIVLGHQLRYIMPIISSAVLATPTSDRTIISVRGTVGTPLELSLDSICLSSAVIIPNAIPIADSGLDQAARTCSIVKLDGSRSFDPEGAALTYRWRLIDTPIGSQFMFDGVDGRTYDTMSDFTNQFYSTTLQDVDAIDPINVTPGEGDVLVVGGLVYDLVGKGVDGGGFYLQVDGFVLPDSFFNKTFKLLRQRGISGPTQTKPTFFPDLPGLYKFDLIVFDGGLFSDPSVTIVNVTESPVPRGCIPDVTFLWDYLSDFWRLVEDKERIETFWSASAQVVGSELLALWQIDYSKSLRDVQRTFQRRWLNYELLVNDPFPELTSLRIILGGIRQVFPIAGLAGIPGTTLTFTIPFFATDGSSSFSSVYTFTGSGVLTAQQVANQLSNHLSRLDNRFVVTVTNNSAATEAEIRIDAPFLFNTEATDSAPIFESLTNSEPAGSGAGVGVKTYKVDRSLLGLDIQEGDILGIGTESFRIRSVVDDPSDEWPFQRITLLDTTPTAPATSWILPGKISSKLLDFYNSHVHIYDLLYFDLFDRQTQLTATIRLQGARAVSGSVKEVGVIGLSAIANFLQHPTRQYSVFFRSIKRLSHLPIDPLVVDIPYLQEKIKQSDDTAILRRNIDYFIEEFRGTPSIRFAFTGFGETGDIWEDPETSPSRLWAETTYLDNREVIEQNFGIPVDFSLDDLSQLPPSVDYLSAVRGLWYSYFKGPTISNLRIGTQILLGLPFAEEAGVIQEIRADFSPNIGRLLIADQKNPEVVRSYTYPISLAVETNPNTGLAYAVGDTVTQFAPLIGGIEVVDWVKNPEWFAGYLQQGNFYEIEKFFKFLVRVDSAAFNLSALLFVQSFILRIKPTYTYPLFVIRQLIGADGSTEISTTDEIEYSGRLLLFDGACFQFNGESTLGIATMVDEPDPSGGGWQSKVDTDYLPATPDPTFPTPQFTAWGVDHTYLCPEDSILSVNCDTYEVPALPILDSVFKLDTPITAAEFAIFEDSWVTYLPDTDTGITLIPAEGVVVMDGTITSVRIRITGNNPDPDDATYDLVIFLNDVETEVIPFTQTYGPLYTEIFTVSIPVVIDDILEVRARRQTSGERHHIWDTITVELGAVTTWVLDTNLDAGTYCNYEAL